MIESLVLIEGQNVSEETLRSLGLGNALQVVVGNAQGFGVILHINAESPLYFSQALQEFAEVPGVDRVVTLALRTAAD
jgi:hypothetical protein